MRQETIGPYDTVVLSSEDPGALTTWLIEKGYAIPDAIVPVIESYVTDGNDFLALRLSPGQGVQQMEPVRVVTPGGDYLLPLRMVAAGVGLSVSIKLFVIAETRYAMPDLFEVNFPTFGLSYDFLTGKTNFEELRTDVLTQNRGKSYLVTYASRLPFSRPNDDPFGRGPQPYQTDHLGHEVTTLAKLYFELAGAGTCCAARSKLKSNALVVPCVGAECVDDPSTDGLCDASGEGGAGSGSASAGGGRAGNESTTISSREFACRLQTDLARALEGMHPANVWLTRMEMNLPLSALDADCAVTPAKEASTRSVFYGAKVVTNPPCKHASISTAGSLAFGVWCATGLLVRRRTTRRRSYR